MDLSSWEETPRVQIDLRRDFGRHLLVATGDRKPEFKLMPRWLRNGINKDVVVGFHVTFDEGRMLPNWEELQFFPRGYEAPQALSRTLPPWSEENEALYLDVLDPLVTKLYAAQCNIERLEAKLPLFVSRCEDSKRQLTVDHVRMVYLKNVVEWPADSEEPTPADFTPHLVVMVFSYADGFKVMQNGVGTGPPKKVGGG